MNILYIGSSGALSLIPFKKLLFSEHKIAAVGIYKPILFKDKIIAVENESLALAAKQAGLPVIDLSQNISDIVSLCSAFDIDLTLMSCYSKRLPDELIQLADKGCYNLHPSLLPAYRGPEPIFWQMKHGSEMGVSWHQVISDFDAGDLAAQKKVFIDDGLTHAEISLLLAEAGAKLLPELLPQISTSELRCKVQDKEQLSYFPYPQPSDFFIDTSCDAQQNYNFMRATQAFGLTYRYQYDDSLFYLTEAIDYDNNQTLESPEVQSGRIYIPCDGGVLIAAYTDKMST